MFLLLGLWTVKIQSDAGRWIWVNDASAYNLYLGNNAWTPHTRTWWLGSHDVKGETEYEGFIQEKDSIQSLPPQERQDSYSQLAWKQILEHPGTFLIRTLFRFTNFWGFDALAGGSLKQISPQIGWLFLGGDVLCYGFVLWVFLSGMRRLNGATRAFGIWLILFYLAPYLLAFGHPTYHLPLLPWIFLLGGHAVSRQLPLKWDRSFYIILIIVSLIQLVWFFDLFARL